MILKSLDVLVNEVLTLNVQNASIVDVSAVRFSKEFRVFCEQNKCGHYNRNWMCPPGLGRFEDLMEQARRYKQGLVFQTVHRLTKSFDFTGMYEGAKIHEQIVRNVLRHFVDRSGIKEVLPLGIGSCKFCEVCAYVEGEKCPYPEKAIASLESYGIDVGHLLKHCGMPYRHGKLTLSYEGCLLFNFDEYSI